MADTVGVSQSYVDSEIAALRSDVNSDLLQLERKVEHVARRIEELEETVREMVRAVVDAIEHQTRNLSAEINTQTAAVVGGVIANTAMIERTKDHIGSQLALQTEADLQVIVGRQLGEAKALGGKIQAFKADIDSRYKESMNSVGLNWHLYNEHFGKIFAEFQSKLLTIGNHIYRIKEEDISLAEEAASVPIQVTHGLPLDVDRDRIEGRKASLDDSLALLKASRLDEVVQATRMLDGVLQHRFGIGLPADTEVESLEVNGYACVSETGTSLFVDCTAQEMKVEDGKATSLISPTPDDLGSFSNPQTVKGVTAAINAARSLAPEATDFQRILAAADRLLARQSITREGHGLLQDFLGRGLLETVRS